MNSLSQLLERTFNRFREEKAHEFGFERYSCLPDKNKKEIPNFKEFLSLLGINFIIGNLMDTCERIEAKRRYKELRYQCWLAILRYKYICHYDLDDPHRLEDIDDVALWKVKIPRLRKMPMENSMELIEYIVAQIDKKVNYLVLPREQEFTAEVVYDDLRNHGVYTGGEDD